MRKIGIIGGALAPLFNEAMANQIKILSKRYDIPVITCNDLGWRPFLRHGRYTIINSKFLIRRTPVLSLLNGAFLYLVIRYYGQVFDRIILPGGPESEFLKYLNPGKCIPIVTSTEYQTAAKSECMREKYQEFLFLLVQGEKIRSQILLFGVPQDRICFIFPVLDNETFFLAPPPQNMSPFRILFASAPNLILPGEDNYSDKGVPLLLHAFKKFQSAVPDSELIIIWRGKCTERLMADIRKLNLQDSIEVIDRIVEMPGMYEKVHASVLPYKNLNRSPEFPMSAIESIYRGRPVISTDVPELSQLITEFRCGSVSKPTPENLADAIYDCYVHYSDCFHGCRSAISYMNREHYENSDQMSLSRLCDVSLTENG